MKDDVRRRLATLQSEHEAGTRMLAELEAKRQSLSATLLRIEGAMAVLRELLDAPGAPPGGAGEG
jgi:septal ring factor EnvC (AmiA/AmiB activator)